MNQGAGNPPGGSTAAWINGLAGAPASLQRAHAPGASSAAVAVLGEAVTSWGIARAAEVHAGLVTDISAAELTEGGHEAAAVEAAILAMLTTLVTQHAFETPAEAVSQVRWAARQGLPLASVLRVVWHAHAGVQDSLIDAVTAALRDDRLAAEVKRLSSVLLEVVATLINDLSAVYERESAAWGRDRAAGIRRVIDRIVDTGERPLDAEEVLGIRLSDHHLAAALCPVGTSTESAWRSDVARWVETVRDRLGAATALLIPRTDGSTEAIWSRPSLPTATEFDALRDIELPAAVNAALGVAADGVAGLRDSVTAARRVAAAMPSTSTPMVWTYDEHGVLALLLNDPAAARDFLRRTLAGLLGSGDKMRLLRETLLSYLEHEGSRNQAAQELHIAPTTVAYRVRQAQERLDPRMPRTRTGLVVALTLARHCPELAH